MTSTIIHKTSLFSDEEREVQIQMWSDTDEWGYTDTTIETVTDCETGRVIPTDREMDKRLLKEIERAAEPAR